MIKKHNSLIRAEKILNSFINAMYSHDNLDGIIETFKDNKKQGYVMKIYNTYIPDTDLCIWLYEDLEDKKINVIIGNHNNCDELNRYNGNDLIYKQYPVVTNIKKTIVENLIDDVYKHYDKQIII